MLHKAGVSFGEQLNDPHPINPAGFFEDTDFIQLHKAALEGAGAAWNDPPAPDGLQDIVAGDFSIWASNLIAYKCKQAQKRGDDAWGVKTLRGLWLMPLYVPILAPHDVQYIVTYRNPLSVARSFQRAWPEEYAELGDVLELIARYELGIAQFLKVCGRPSSSCIRVSFESLFDHPRKELDKLERLLGRKLAREHMDPTLRHF